MSKHTAGPWYSNGTRATSARAVWNTNGDIDIVPSKDERQICVAGPDLFFDGKCPDREEMEANLRLIAAAPDLLAACKDADRLLSVCEFSDAADLAAIARISAAIATAEAQS